MENKKIVFKQKSSLMRTFLGVLVLASGIIILISGSLYGLIACGLSVSFLYRDGSEIDFETNKYRTFMDVLGLRFGKWKKLPEIDYISVFSTTETITVRSRSAEANVTNDVIVLNLFYNGNHRIKAYKTNDEEDAFKIAKQIAKILKIDILDATKAESKWI